MRFYAIKISGGQAGSAFPVVPGAWISGAQFCSAVDTGMGFGLQNDPSAMRCVLQLEMQADAVLGLVRLWGIDTQMIDQAADLSGAAVEVYGGFWPGLPLATWESQYTGLLYTGQVQAAYGNWEGSDMTLDIYLNPGKSKAGADGGGGTSVGDVANMPNAQSRLISRQQSVGRQFAPKPPPSATQFDLGGLGGAISGIANAFAGFATGGWGSAPLNLIHDMKEGMTLDKALDQTLSTAFPDMQFVSLIKDGMKLNYHDAGAYQTVDQLIGYVKGLSKDLANDKDYPGVSLYAIKDKLIGADGTKAYGTVYLQAWDLIGQPTWGGAGANGMQINFMTPMRADIFPTMLVYLPNDVWQNLHSAPGGGIGGYYNSGYPTSVRDRMHFNGPFFITRVLINGDSRHPDGKSWALSVTGYYNDAGSYKQWLPTDFDASYGAGAPSPGMPATPNRLTMRGRGVG